MESNCANPPSLQPALDSAGNGGMEDEVDEKLNLKGIKCPITFVKTKMKLEELQNDRSLEILVDNGEPLQSLPRLIKEEGHKIMKFEMLADNSYRFLVRKGGRDSDGG